LNTGRGFTELPASLVEAGCREIKPDPFPQAHLTYQFVMAGLVPAIHVFCDVDARDQPGHDEF
jgi:hypothetical protein